MNGDFNLIELFQMGGIFMWPLLVFSILTLGLLMERALYLLFHDLDVRSLGRGVLGKISEGHLEEAVLLVNQSHKRKSAARILQSLLSHVDLGEHRMEKAAEAEAAEQVGKLENGFNFLTALASLAPLTGFLGTVSGMIGAFRSIANAQEVNAQLVASGIYEALITTVFGLIIAIIALAGFNLLAHFVDRFSSQVEKVSSDIIAGIEDQRVRGNLGAKAG